MSKFSEDIEQFREDVTKVATEMFTAYEPSECDVALLEELWEALGEGIHLPSGFFKDVMDNLS
jgi:hypothetical protein